MNRWVWRSAGYLLPVGLWFIAARSLDLAVALPPPGTVFLRTVLLFGDEGFLTTVFLTVFRTIAALGIGAVISIPLGVAAARSTAVRDVIAPSIRAVRAIPFISIILVAVIWFSSGTVPSFVALLMIAPLLYESAYTGVRGVDPKLEEMTRSFALSRTARLRHLWIPGATPTMLGGLRGANGIAWKVTVAAEVISVPRRGIGTEMGEARLFLETETVLAWTVVLIVVAGLSDRVIGAIEYHCRQRKAKDRVASGRTGVIPDTVPEAPPTGTIRSFRSGLIAPVIKIRDLSFTWRSRGAGSGDELRTGGEAVSIVRGLSAELAAGEVTALIGPSGVGKTTILRLIGGVLRPESGTIETPGTTVHRTATVFQEPRLLPWRTVGENVALGRGPAVQGWGAPGQGSGRPGDDAAGEIGDALRTVNLEGQSEGYPEELSGGMQQRVALARALYAHPDLLLIDEPLSGVDQAHRGELSEYLRSVITASGVTTVISSHDLPFVYTVADRILLLEERPARIVLDVHRDADGWPARTVREIEERLRRSRHTL